LKCPSNFEAKLPDLLNEVPILAAILHNLIAGLSNLATAVTMCVPGPTIPLWGAMRSSGLVRDQPRYE